MQNNRESKQHKLSKKELREIQLDILNNVNDFCLKNHINCFLSYGTLIGAVRHKGYIPWDDDIDIMMTRPDYDKFVEIYHSDKYKLININIDPKYPYSFSKIHDPSTEVIEYSSIKYDIGVNIDLFSIDGLPMDEKKRNQYINKLLRLRSLKEIKRIKLSKERSSKRNAMLVGLKLFTFFIPYQFLIKRLVRFIKKYDYMQSEIVGELNFTNKNRCFPKQEFEKTTEVEFENKHYKAPAFYDHWLTVIYGNYRNLPPEKDQKTHHVFHAYRKIND